MGDQSDKYDPETWRRGAKMDRYALVLVSVLVMACVAGQTAQWFMAMKSKEILKG